MPRLSPAVLALALLVACAPSAPPAAKPAAPAAATAAPAKPASAAPAAGSAPAAAAAPTAVAPLRPTEKVHVGVLYVIGMAAFIIAEERGFYTEEGLEAEFTRFDSGARMVAPLAAGQLDAGMGAHSAGLFNALNQGVNLKVVGSNVLLNPGRSPSTIVARKELLDAGLRPTAADIRGKTIAHTATGSTVHVNVGRWLDNLGLRQDEVQMAELGQPDMNPALANGAIDLANNTEPFVTAGIESGIFGRVAAVVDYYPNREVSVVMYGGPFMQDRPEVARRLMVAYLRGQRVYEDAFSKGIDKDAVVNLLVERLPIKDRTLYDKMYAGGTLSYANPDGHVSTDSIAWDQDWMLTNGLIRAKVDLAQVIDHQYVEYALGRLGRYQR